MNSFQFQTLLVAGSLLLATCGKISSTIDGGDSDLSACPTDPIVLYDLVAADSASAVADTSGVDPIVDLTADPRSPLGIELVEGGLEFTNGRLEATQAASNALRPILAADDTFSIVIWVTPENITQGGPARIVTLSAGAFSRSITFAQTSDLFLVRLRTTSGDSNGFPHFGIPAFDAGRQVHLATTFDIHQTGYVNGHLRTRIRDYPGSDLSFLSGRLGLGNEFSADRPWQGIIHRVEIYDRALSDEEVACTFSRGPGAN